MEIIHTISFRVSEPGVVATLRRIGFQVAGGQLASLEVAESDSRWPDLKAWVDGLKPSAVDMVTTTFADAEERAADWLRLVPEWHHGYPQPENGYLEATYDLSDRCLRCGIGARQKAPFSLEAEPRWGDRSIMQINWVFGEFFIRPEIIDMVARPLGIATRPVLKRSGRPLETVVQLVVEESIPISHDALEVESRCADCGRTKYRPFTTGYFPDIGAEPREHVARTVEWFGSGLRAFREVLVSRDFRRALVNAGVRGVRCWPVGQGPS